MPTTLAPEQPAVRIPEKPIAPRPAEQIQEPDPQGREIADRIVRDGDPDRVLQDIVGENLLVIPEVSPNESPVTERKVNLENLYREEVASRKVDQTLPSQRAWEQIEEAAASREKPHAQVEEHQTRPRSIMDKVQRQALLVQARLEGVKDLGRFQELADYFEATVSESEDKHVKVPKGLSDEQKQKVIADWKSKGWHGNAYHIYDYSGEKQASLTLRRTTPIHLTREHIKLMKGLISADNNPVELAEGLKSMGFWFSEYILNSPKEMAKLGEFFTAPHAKEALELAHGISRWGSDWFANEGSYGKTVEVGQIEFLAQLAQSPDPKATFPPELVQKVNTLSTALNMRVGVAEIGQLQTIINNPDYLDFAVYLTKFGDSISSYRERIPVFDNIVALDQAGLLKPVVELYRSGVSIESSDRYYSYSGTPSLKKLFDSYEAESKPQEVRQEVTQHLQEALNQPELQSFLADTQRREFVGLLADTIGYPLSIEELKSLDTLFGEDLGKRSEAAYLVKLLYGTEDAKYRPDLGLISGIMRNPNIIQAFTDQDFPKFLEDLRTKGSFRPSNYDLYFAGRSKIADVFNNPETRQALTQDGTLEIIKALHPQGTDVDLYKPEYYIGLAQNPNALHTINLLKDLGCQFGSSSNNPSKETIETLANSPESLTKLALPELKDLAARLKGELKWEVRSYDVTQLLEMYDDKNFQQQLFAPDNSEFIKKMRPHGLSLLEVKPLLALDQQTRGLLVGLADKFGYLPQLGWGANRVLQDQDMLSRLLTDIQLREGLFSDNTQQLVGKLRTLGYYRFNPNQTELLISLPSDFPEFVGELTTKYNYNFSDNDLSLLKNLQGDRENLYQLVDGLVGSGYTLNLKDLDKLAPLVGLVDKMPTLLADLKEVVGYQFDPKDTELLANLAGGDFTKDRLTSLKGLYEHYKNQYDGEFGLNWVQRVAVLEGQEGVITQLEQNTGHKFTLYETESLRLLVNAPDRDKVFAALNVLQSKFSMQFQMNNMSLYISLANIPDLGKKLDEAVLSLPQGELNDGNNLRLFASLGGEVGLYNHAKKLIYDDYFRGIRDAQNRIGQFMNSVYRGEISDPAVARVFAVSTKATELDRLALKLGINAEIARAANREDWYGSLLQASNFQEANEGLTKLMTELALPVVYGDLQGEDFVAKQNELLDLASKDREFGDILEICCRSVGVYGKKYPNRGAEFTTLMGGIKQSLELNLERTPRTYLQRRAELSTHQFDRIFEGFPQDVRDRTMQAWLDLSSKRRLRVSGEVVTAEEATLNRLNRIRDITQTDLSVHLQALFTEKIKELEAASGQGETNGIGAEQLAIYKEYLLTPEGEIRQDIPNMYRSVETFIRSGQQALKNPNTSKEEKARLGKSMGTYQAVSDSLRALYRLGTISEERYKARRDYLSEIDKHMGEFSGALKKLRILNPEKRATDVNTRALEEEVLLDFGKLRGTMAEENVSGQTIFETESTVAFRDLARAPEMTQSCQRLTEVTGFNQAAYSRLVDGSNEMIDVYELRNGEKNRLARSFIELSRVNITGEEQPKLAVLIDREYVNPQYQNFSLPFSTEMVAHMIDRVNAVPEVSLLFDSYRIAPTAQIEALLRQRGYQMRQVSGKYFINESNVKLAKYYDSMGGVTNVAQPSSRQFGSYYLVEKV